MRQLRYFIVYIVAVTGRYKYHLLILSLAFVGLALLLNSFKDRFETKWISEGIVGTYTTKDLPTVVTSLLSTSLLIGDAQYQIKPLLVDNWQVNKEVNEYTFNLKNNLHWNDGSLIKASEIALPISDVIISYPDDKTIKFKLSEAFSPLPTLLTKPILKKNSFIGTGPYQIDSIETNAVFVTKIKLKSATKSLPNLIIRFYPNERTAISALKIGEVQSILGIGELNEIAREKPFEFYSATNHLRIVTIFYNTKDPILSDENFRLALSFASPSIKGEEVAVTSIPSSSWAFNSDVKDYLDNTKQAKIFLEKVKKGRDETITLTVTSSLQKVGEKVVEAWKQFGIKAVLRVESGIPQNFQALLITQNIPYDPDQYSLWHGTQTTTNISQVSLPRVDKDLEDGRKTADLAQRKLLYKDFQKVLLDHAPATFLYFPKNNVVYLKKIGPQLKQILDLQLKNLNQTW